MLTSVISLVALILVAILASVLKFYLPSYLRKRAENLATRQDIDIITQKVEEVRTEYASELERLKSRLQRTSLVHKIQFETEFRSYELIWEHLVEVQRAVQILRPILDTYAEGEDAQRERKLERLNQFIDAYNGFLSAVNARRPFYPPEIWAKIGELSKVLHREGRGYQFGHPFKDPDYWKEATENAQLIVSKIDEICEAIRERIASLEVV